MPRVERIVEDIAYTSNDELWGVVNSSSNRITFTSSVADSWITYSPEYNRDYLLDSIAAHVSCLNDPAEANKEIDKIIEELTKLRRVVINSVQEIE